MCNSLIINKVAFLGVFGMIIDLYRYKEDMDKTQYIDNQPLMHNSLVINQLQNVDKMWITFTIMIRNIEKFVVVLLIQPTQ
jgi:hypothetical protein